MDMAIQMTFQYMINRELFSNYYLENLLPESNTWRSVDEDEIKRVYDNIKDIYEDHKTHLETYQEDFLEDKFIRPIFKELGLEYGTREAVKKRQRFPDYGIFSSEEELKKAYENKEAGNFYKNAITIAEAKRWGRNLDKRGGVRDFTNPSHQIYVYLQETPVDWAILTNGQKWRLYYSKTSHKLDSYYEIDLPYLLEYEDGFELFKYFYLLFRSKAFVKDKSGKCFLDKVYDKSNLFSQELGKDLRENIYEAIRLLAEGFLKYSDNKLDAVKDISLIHDSSLIYLYRLIFVLYAESEGRDLLDTSNRIYNEDYSLNTLKQEVCGKGEYNDWQTKIWDRLESLFVLIDKGSKNQGIPEEDLYIPAYNGGLFRTDVNPGTDDEVAFLQDNKVGDSYLAKVIDLLTRHESKNGDGRVFVDYSSLDIRHLGSIYEGLLEYHLNVATEPMVAVKDGKQQKWFTKEEFEDGTIVEELDEGEVYLTTDKGERKATGSYYTPEYIVQYIVENTLDPILEDIKEELLKKKGGNFANEFAERVFQLKILDPAMGSGHFLTNAVDHLAKEIVDANEKQAEKDGVETIDESHDIHWARRQVVQRCIYGVDLNPMAVELAKVSLWLRTLAARQPLAFLDHHLKTGNSLIGSDIEEIEELGSAGKKKNANSATLEDFGMTKKGTMEDLMKIYQDFIKIENQELSDIKEMEEKYHEFEHEPIRERLEAMANVQTARDFDLDIPKDAFPRMARSIKDEKKWKAVEKEEWFEDAQEMAKEKNFFHWKLEFPEVFYGETGGSKVDAGFDVVMGNPPWGELKIDSEKEYVKSVYKIIKKGKVDMYPLFITSSIILTKRNGIYGNIIPNTILFNTHHKPIRNYILKKTSIDIIYNLSKYIFEDAPDTVPVILICKKSKKSSESMIVKQLKPKTGLEGFTKRQNDIDCVLEQIKFEEEETNKFNPNLCLPSTSIFSNISKDNPRLNEFCIASQGIKPYATKKEGNEKEYVTHNLNNKGKNWYKALRGRNIDRYSQNWEGEYVLYGDWLYSKPREQFENTECIFFQRLRKASMFPRIIACFAHTGEVKPLAACSVMKTKKETNLNIKYILALIDSKLINVWYKTFDTDVEIKIESILKIPILDIDFKTDEYEKTKYLEESKKIYKEYLNAKNNSDAITIMLKILETDKINLLEQKKDIMHDFLVYLVDQMTELNTKKKEYINNFWIDLEGIVEYNTFQKLEKGKQERSLFKNDSCKPYVEEGSYTTFKLDRALLWDVDGFKGFVKILVDNIKNLSEIINIYEKYSSDICDIQNKTQKTDELIDSIVYELYGLTDEEIKIVEQIV